LGYDLKSTGIISKNTQMEFHQVEKLLDNKGNSQQSSEKAYRMGEYAYFA
jgi:hypothetical protein